MSLPNFSILADPISQFEIKRLISLRLLNFDISFTNSALWMVIGLSAIIFFFTIATKHLTLIPSRIQMLAELFYELIAGMVRDLMGSGGLKFVPFVFSVFLFVLISNLFGLIPSLPFLPHELHTFTPTSHIIVTGCLAMFIIILVVIVGLLKHGFGFFKLFAPSGLPLPLYFFIVPIEVISFLVRPLSLSVRLFANMMAGHLLLKIFAGFCVSLLGLGGIMAVSLLLPLSAIIGITLLELLVAVIQAYVFAILTCVYLNDALHPSH